MDNEGQVLLELEKLRGAVNEGFAKLAGRLDAGDQRAGTQGEDIGALKKEVEVLKARVYKLSTLAAVLGTAGATGLTQLLGG